VTSTCPNDGLAALPPAEIAASGMHTCCHVLVPLPPHVDTQAQHISSTLYRVSSQAETIKSNEKTQAKKESLDFVTGVQHMPGVEANAHTMQEVFRLRRPVGHLAEE
jgi:hypothetical protein